MILWDTFIESAEQSLAEGSLSKAEELYLSALEEVDSDGCLDIRAVQTLQGLCEVYFRQARQGYAKPYLERLSRLLEALTGCTPEQRLQAMQNLASLQEFAGDFPRAEAIWRQMLEFIGSQSGISPHIHAETARKLALGLLQKGREGEAEELLQLTWRLQPDGPDSVAVLQILAGFLIRRGQWAQADVYLEPLCQRLRPDDPGLSQWRSHRARSLASQGKHTEAVEVYETLLSLDYEWTEDQVEQAVRAAQAAFEIGKIEVAERLAESVLGSGLRIDSSQRFALLLDLQRSAQSRQDEARAQGFLKEAIGLHEAEGDKVAASVGRDVLVECYWVMGASQHKARHWQETLRHYATALQLHLTSEAPSYSATVEKVSILGDLQVALERWDDAEKSLRIGMQALERGEMSQTPQAARLFCLLGTVYRGKNRLAQAEQLTKKALGLLETLHGSESPELLDTLDELSKIQRNQGDKPSYKQTRQRMAAIRGEEYVDEISPEERLEEADLLLAEGEIELAESLLLDLQQQLESRDAPEVIPTYRKLAQLREGRADWPGAVDFHRKAVGWLQKKGDAGEWVEQSFALSSALARSGSYEEAEILLSQLVGVASKLGFADSAAMGRYKALLGEVYRFAGKDRLAEPALVDAVRLLGLHEGPVHPDLIESRRNLALLYRDQGAFTKAEEQLTHILTGEEQAYGKEHPELAITLSQLGELATARGDYARAETLFRDALKLSERGLGGEHPNVASTHNNLAQILLNQTRYDEARQHLEQALELFAAIPGHSGVVHATANLGVIYLRQGELEHAESLLTKAMAWAEEHFGSADLEVAFCCFELAEIYWRQSRFQEASDLSQRALALRIQSLGREHSETAASLLQCALVYSKLGQPQRALEKALLGLRVQESVLGPEHPELAQAVAMLGEIYWDLKLMSECGTTFQRAVRMFERASATGGCEFMRVLVRQADVLEQQGRTVEALANLVRAQELQVQVLGPDHEDTVTLWRRLARLHQSKAQWKEAEVALRKILEAISRRSGNEVEMSAALATIAALYGAQGKAAVAESLYKKAADTVAELPSREALESILGQWERFLESHGKDAAPVRQRYQSGVAATAPPTPAESKPADVASEQAPAAPSVDPPVAALAEALEPFVTAPMAAPGPLPRPSGPLSEIPPAFADVEIPPLPPISGEGAPSKSEISRFGPTVTPSAGESAQRQTPEPKTEEAGPEAEVCATEEGITEEPVAIQAEEPEAAPAAAVVAEQGGTASGDAGSVPQEAQISEHHADPTSEPSAEPPALEEVSEEVAVAAEPPLSSSLETPSEEPLPEKSVEESVEESHPVFDSGEALNFREASMEMPKIDRLLSVEIPPEQLAESEIIAPVNEIAPPQPVEPAPKVDYLVLIQQWSTPGEVPPSPSQLVECLEGVRNNLRAMPRARALEALADYHLRLGEIDEASHLLDEGLVIREQIDGREALTTVEAYAHLAEMLSKTGRIEQSEAVWLRVIDLRARALGGDDPSVADALAALGHTYVKLKNAQASPLLYRALQIYRRRKPDDYALLSRTITALGLLAEGSSRRSEAIVHYREALQIRKMWSQRENRPLDAEDGDLSLRLTSLGLAEGDLDVALASWKEARAILPAVYTNPELGGLAQRLGPALLEAGREEDAEMVLSFAIEAARAEGALTTEHAPLLSALIKAARGRERWAVIVAAGEELLQLQQASFGANSAVLLGGLYDVGEALIKVGRVAEAHSMLERSLVLQEAVKDGRLASTLLLLASVASDAGQFERADELIERALGVDTPGPNAIASLIVTLEKLGHEELASGLAAAAEAKFRKALGLREQVGVPDLTGLAATTHGLGCSLMEQSRWEEAEAALRKSFEIRSQLSGSESPVTIDTLFDLAKCYHGQHKFEAAESFLSRIVDLRKRLLGPQSFGVGEAHRVLGQVKLDQLNFASAEEHLVKALDIFTAGAPALEQGHVNLLLGQVRTLQGRPADAQAFYRENLRLVESELGPGHARTADAMALLAENFDALGQHAEAEPLARQTLDLRLKSLGPNHREVFSSRIVLARTLTKQDKIQEARELYEQSLAGLWAEYGEDHAEVAQCLEGLGCLETRLGRWDEAESRLQRALAIRERTAGASHPSVAESVNNLGLLYETSRRYDLAERSYKRVLEVRTRALGADHPLVAESLESLGRLYTIQGRYVPAEALFERALELKERVLGQDHIDRASAFLGLGKIYLLQNQLAQADTTVNNARKLLETDGGANALEVAEAFHLLGEIARTGGRFSEARGFFEKSLTIRHKSLGPNHLNVGLSLLGLGLLSQELAQYEICERFLTRAVQIFESVVGPDHPSVADSLHALGILYRATGRGANSELFLKRSMEIRTKSLGSEHPDLATSLFALAQLYLDQRNDAAAEALLKRALEIREKVFRADHPALASIQLILARMYKSQEKYSEAEPLFKRVMDQKDRLYGPQHPETATVMRELAELYQLRGQKAQAETLHRRALDILERRLGTQHPSLLPSLHLMLDLYKAASLQTEVDKIQQRISLIESARGS